MCLAALVSCNKPDDGKEGGDNSGTDTRPALSSLTSGNTTVIYEANPKLFSQSSAIKSIEQNLDRIANMKVNVLWLMPIYPVGTEKSVGSPYCVKDYNAVNSAYGSLSDVKSLVTSAHNKGMKVILDWVPNHTAWDHAWIKEHSDWYTKDAKGNIISPPEQSWSDVADLNYNNAELRSAMISAMEWWIDNAGIDGFRCDYAEGVPVSFWNEAIPALRKKKADLIMLAEANKAELYKSGFDYLYAWTYADALPAAIKGASNLTSLYSIAKEDVSGLAEGQNRMRYIINHDTASEYSPVTLYGDAKGAMAAFVLSAFLPGVPMIYSSQEIGYAQKVDFFKYNVMSWTSNEAVSSEYVKVMGAYAATEKYRGVTPQMSDLGKVACIYYSVSGYKLLVMVNVSSTEQTGKVPIELSGLTVKDMISGKSLTLSTSVTLGAHEYLICTY